MSRRSVPITLDVAATRRRRGRLARYVTTSLLDGQGFRCPHFEECKGSRQPGDDFREGIMSHVGRRYDLTRGDRPLRIMVVGQESGLPKGTNANSYAARVSLESRYEQVRVRAGEERRYIAQDGLPGRNPHMRGTTSLLRVLLGDGPGKDYEGEWVHPVNGKPFHLFDGFALVNRLLCSAGHRGSSTGRPTLTMRDNCADHFTRTLEILQPTLVVLQGTSEPRPGDHPRRGALLEQGAGPVRQSLRSGRFAARGGVKVNPRWDEPTAKPARHLAVLACMDARIDVHDLFGLDEGDAARDPQCGRSG